MLGRLLSPCQERVYAAMRMVVGLLLTFHGLQKVFGVLSEHQPPVGSQMWIGGVIELVAGTLIAVGLLTVWAAFIASGMLAVGYVQFHWKFAFDSAFFPVVNQGELAVVYAFLFLYIASKGSGIASLDGMRSKSSA